MAPPRFGHLVLRTHHLAAMSAWYGKVLGARIVAENARMCFLTYDEEHHRIALVDVGMLEPWRGDVPGLLHAAFGLATLIEVVEKYAALRAEGLLPVRAVHHGVTVSLYYRDPDGNEVELFADTPAASERAALLEEASAEWSPDQAAELLRDGGTEQALHALLSLLHVREDARGLVDP